MSEIMPGDCDNLQASPRVSVIIPTLNAEAILENCLAPIVRQTYPRENIEIILADAHSQDRTREIAKKYGAIVLDDDGKNMEEGKRLALRRATGEYIVFVDADNEISHPDYIALAVKALAANPQALGVESYYLPSPKMSSFCAYLSHLLHISDPVCWLMSRSPVLVARDGEVERWKLSGDSFSYPLGANGFVFRRADLESVGANEHFQDTRAALHLMRSGKREWLRIRGRGVHHYYVQTLWGFVQKRRRATVHFLRVQEAAKTNWMKEKPSVPLWLAGVYCVTFVGPLWHTARGLVCDRDPRWLWHVPASLASVLGNAWGLWTYRTRKQDEKLVANLKPKQTLIKKQPDDYTNYPESALRERIKLARDWIPADCQRLLDGGCAFGYGTRHFKTKAAEAWGVDPNQTFIAIAQQRYPNISFRVGGLEQTSFEAGYFDVIILNDVLEHVIDERKALNEMCRILALGGTLIISTPHRGLFSFMDPDNYIYHLRTKTPRLYRWLYRAKYGKAPPDQLKPGYEQHHRHYNRQDFVRLLNGSDFQGRYEIDRIFQGGLLMGVFTSNLYEFSSLFLGMRLAGSLTKPLRWLADKEYFIPFGPLAYTIAIRVKKLK